MIIVFITCKNKSEAEKIGTALLKKRLAGCFIVVPKVYSAYFWPPKKNRIEKSSEAILLVKTLKKKWTKLEQEIKRIHSYTVPFIATIQVTRVNQEYLQWIRKEIA